MTRHEVEKYRKPIRILHWIHSGAFILLFLTGLVLFIPGLGFLAEDSWTRVIHRVGAAVFVIIPVIYLVINPRAVGRGLKQAFTWGSDDMGWLKAAPRYYFLGDESSMPPQGAMNTGQKMWWFFTIVFGIIFVITGAIMWFAKLAAPAALLQWMVFIHDVSFIVTGAMFLLHLYLGVFHPLMTEAWNAMAGGKISTEYAKAHHTKWYDEVTKSKEEKA
ncbi:MAG TPA: cytochrome b/b6 domain-containing protein [Dehalococcoidales bacterium]|nr:cytochrome b/b6 domain-containing protein [Dehalococcoidales bacterium]